MSMKLRHTPFGQQVKAEARGTLILRARKIADGMRNGDGEWRLLEDLIEELDSTRSELRRARHDLERIAYPSKWPKFSKTFDYRAWATSVAANRITQIGMFMRFVPKEEGR